MLIVFFILFKEPKEEEKYYEDHLIIFENYVDKYYSLEEGVMEDFLLGFKLLYEEFPQYTKHISPLDMIAIGHVETRFRNLIGDEGLSLGYFQIQQETYWFVKHRYSLVYNYLNFNEPWIWDIVKDNPKIQLITSYLYLNYLYERFSNRAFFFYNGGSTAYDILINEKLTLVRSRFQ